MIGGVSRSVALHIIENSTNIFLLEFSLSDTQLRTKNAAIWCYYTAASPSKETKPDKILWTLTMLHTHRCTPYTSVHSVQCTVCTVHIFTFCTVYSVQLRNWMVHQSCWILNLFYVDPDPAFTCWSGSRHHLRFGFCSRQNYPDTLSGK